MLKKMQEIDEDATVTQLILASLGNLCSYIILMLLPSLNIRLN